MDYSTGGAIPPLIVILIQWLPFGTTDLQKRLVLLSGLQWASAEINCAGHLVDCFKT